MFIVFHFMDTLVLIVIYRYYLCYLVYRRNDHKVVINLSWVE